VRGMDADMICTARPHCREGVLAIELVPFVGAGRATGRLAPDSYVRQPSTSDARIAGSPNRAVGFWCVISGVQSARAVSGVSPNFRFTDATNAGRRPASPASAPEEVLQGFADVCCRRGECRGRARRSL
jgi:hypothetical protein